jgi:uncharacterized protein
MKKLKSLVSWIEIPVSDMSRAKIFYETILNISLQEMPLGKDLIMAFFPVEENGVGGALCYHKEHYNPSENGVVIYLRAEPNIATMLELTQKANGSITSPRKQISEDPANGFMAVIKDTEGNRIAVYENN